MGTLAQVPRRERGHGHVKDFHTSGASLLPLVRPRSVALIGASPDLTRYPGKVLFNLQRFGFSGAIHAITPRHEEIRGLRCLADVSEVVGGADVALILLAASNVPRALQQAIDAGCRSAIVFSAGMGEASDVGRALQTDVSRIAHQHGVRVLGPNCLGCVNVADRIVLSGAAGVQRDNLIDGAIGIAAQSGGIMGSMLDRAWAQGIGISYTFSTGNEADITLADCIDFMVDDPRTRVVCLFIEAVRDVDRFRGACERAAAANKPILALKVGRSERSSRAALSHTGAMVGDYRAYAAWFRRLGVVEVEDLDDLFLTANLLVKLPLPKGDRVAIACISGGLAALGADLCNDLDIPLADLQPETLARIREMQAGFGDALNPLDITGHVVSRENWWMVRRIQEMILADPNVDLLAFGQPASQFAEESSADIIGLISVAEKPVVEFWTGHVSIAAALKNLRDVGIPVFEQTAQCFRAIAAILRVAAFTRSRAAALSSPAKNLDRERQERAIALLRQGGKTLTEHTGKSLLALYGIQSPPEEVVGNRDDAIAAAHRFGSPVAVKAHRADLLHKSDCDAVRLNVDAAGIGEAFDVVTRNGQSSEALIAPMIPPGPELILGLARDPHVGLLLMMGAGGVLVEILDDVALAVPPLWPGEAQSLLQRLRSQKLLDGVRGKPPCDRAAVIRAVEGLSQLVVEVGELIEQVDINPLICTPDGTWAADALVVTRGHDPASSTGTTSRNAS